MEVTDGSAKPPAELVALRRQRDGLVAISALVADARSFEDAFPAVLEAVRDIFDGVLCELWLPEPSSGALQREIFVSADFLEMAALLELGAGSSENTSSSLAHRAWKSCQTQWRDVTSSPDGALLEALTAGTNADRILSFPICAGDVCFGVICVRFSRLTVVDDSVVSLVRTIGAQLGLKICSERRSLQLFRTQQLLSDIVENSTIGMHWADENGKILWASRVELEILGYPSDEYLGRNIAEFHVDKSVGERILGDLSRHEDFKSVAADLRCKDGSIRQVLLSSNALWEDGRFIHSQCYTVDITGRMKEQEAQSLLAAIVESSEDAIISLTLDGRISSWNRAAERIFGYSADEMVGQSISLLYPEDRREPELGSLERLRNGERIDHYETVRLRKDGKTIDVSLSLSPLHDQSGEIVGASKVVRDITQQKLAQAELDENRERFQSFALNAPVALYIKDLAGRYTLANSLACEALGRPEGVEGLSDRDLLDSASADQIRERDLEVISTGRPVESEERVEREGYLADYLSVKFPLFDAEGRAVGVCGVSTDISQRKQSQQELQKSEERFARFMHHLPGLSWIKDDRGRYVFANEAAFQAFQTVAEELYGKTDTELFPPETARQFQENDRRALESETGHQVIETLQHADGTIHHSLVSKFPIPGADGKSTFVGGIAIDVTDRKHAEEALNESEARFRRMASQAPIGIFMSDEKGETIYVNDSWCALAGLSAEDARGKGWVDAIYPDDRDRVVQGWLAAVSAGVDSNAEFRFCRPDGDVIWLQGNAVPLRDAEGQLCGYIGTLADITANKLAMSALAESDERFRFTLQEARVGTWDWNLETGTIQVSSNFAELHDHTSTSLEWDIDGVLELVYAPDRLKFSEVLQRAALTSGSYETDYRFLRRDGSLGWGHAQGKATCDKQGKPARIVGVFIDVTERLLVEEYTRSLAQASALASGELDVAASLETIAGLFVPSFGDWCAVELLDENDNVVHVAAAHADSERVDLVLDLRSRFAENVEASLPAIANAIRNGMCEIYPEIDQEFLQESAYDDEHFQMLCRLGINSAMAVPLIARGKTIGAITLVSGDSGRRYRDADVALIRDLATRCALAVDNASLFEESQRELAERRRIEENLHQANKLAESANRSKSEFLANMSHEIRTPMSAIMGYAELLYQQLHDESHLNYLDIIRRNGDHLLAIVNDVLDLSRIEAGKLEIEKERFSPHDIFFDVCSLMQVRVAEKHLQLTVEFENPIPETIESDPRRLRQVVINLVANAVKFTEKGSVRIVVRFDEGIPVLRFDVIDTGIGISKEQFGRLFEPFSQADSSVTRRYGGSGVGLAVCERLVEMLGGRIEVQSELGVGSIFSVAITTGPIDNVPLIDPNRKSFRQTHRQQTFDALHSWRVLVVDDQADVRELVRRWVEASGGEVVLATNGSEALKAIQSDAKTIRPVDIVVMDMQMPTMDGYQTASRLRKDGFAKPIIAMTAHAMQGDREKCLRAGCDDYVTKPIDFGKLLALMQHFRNKDGATRSVTDECSADVVAEDSTGNRLRLLLVEDDMHVCKLMEMQLETFGYCMRWANTGAEAIQTAKALLPHVVVLDLGLPDMSGYTVAEQLRSLPECRETVIIALSGRSAPEDKQAAKAAGCDHFLVKPVSINTLESLITRLSRNALQTE